VRATGGLEDSVENFDEEALTGDGLKFRQHTATALFDTIGWAAYTFYNNPKGLQALRRNGMKKRFTWDEAALKYEELYMLAVRRRRGAEYFRNRFGE
jgi:starch synthase